MKLLRCSYCNCVKAETEFYSNGKPSGVKKTICVQCSAVLKKINRSINPDKEKEYNRKYRKSHLDYFKDHGKAYMITHREYFAQKSKEFRNRDPIRAKKFVDNWKRDNPDKLANLITKANQIRRANLKKVYSDLPLSILRKIKTNATKCNICGVPFDKVIRKTIDHIIPLSKNGPNTANNIQIICKSCNSSKNNNLPNKTQLKFF